MEESTLGNSGADTHDTSIPNSAMNIFHLASETLQLTFNVSSHATQSVNISPLYCVRVIASNRLKQPL